MKKTDEEIYEMAFGKQEEEQKENQIEVEQEGNQPTEI